MHLQYDNLHNIIMTIDDKTVCAWYAQRCWQMKKFVFEWEGKCKMADMINYYEELNLKKDLQLEEINKELRRLESIWKRREITNPEKATKILALIIDAKEMFQTDSSRKEYDSRLEQESKRIENGNDTEKEKEYGKLMDNAIEYYQNKQFDLAKISIDKALNLAEYSDDEVRMYAYAQSIYHENGFYKDALGFANQAIEISPDDLNLYHNKEIALYHLISFKEQNGQNTSRLIENYRTTCQVWAKKAKEQHDDIHICDALYHLSEAYCDYEPVNYDLAEQYAKEVLEYDENVERAKEILQWLDEPKEVGIDELGRYKEEISPYENAITALVEQIVSQKLKPECELGWVMANKDFFGNYSPNKDKMDEEQSWKVIFALREDGTFVKKEVIKREYWRPGSLPWVKNEEENYVCSLEEIMMEMDFDAYKYHYNDNGWSERSSLVEHVGYCWNSYASRKLTRKYRKKGQALYDRLKGIVDRSIAYVEECKRINKEYEAELAIIKEKITAEYQQKRNALISEKNRKVEEAIKSEVDRIFIQNDISSMQSELSSLGFFSGKRKKELEFKISKAEQQLSCMLTVTQVESVYQKKLDELDAKENAQFSRERDDLRKFKYPLPQQ